MTNWRDALADEPPVLLTGAAGFIGFHVASRLLDAGLRVVGFDNVNAYYDTRLKRARLAVLARRDGFRFIEGDLADAAALDCAAAEAAPARVIHFAAQAGVRYSIDKPGAYAESNLVGFLNILELCRRLDVRHLLYASSSSVYGGNVRLPFSERDAVDHPVSLYAATKKANELMAHAYCHLYGFPATGLRFFTVYGPWGRPDMAYWKFAEAIFEDRPIDIYNHGRMGRDFTYVDDVVEIVLGLSARPAAPDPDFDRAAPRADASWAPHRVYNAGATRPERLLDMIALLEEIIGRAADRRLLPMQPGDVTETYADMTALAGILPPRPATPLDEGLRRFINWYRVWRTDPKAAIDRA